MCAKLPLRYFSHKCSSASADVVGRNTTEGGEGTCRDNRRLWGQYRRGFRLPDSESGIQGSGQLSSHQSSCMERIFEMFKVLEGFFFSL